MSFEVIVSALPDKKLAFTNCVYLHPEHPALNNNTGGFIQINDNMVYSVKPHPSVQLGDIAVNALHRSCCGLSQGLSTRIKPWKSAVSEEESIAMSLHLDVETLGSMRVEVAEQPVVDLFSKVFSGQMACVGMSFCLDLTGTLLKITVKSLEVVKPKESNENKATNEDDSHVLIAARIGQICAETNIEAFGPDQPKQGENRARPLLNLIKNQTSKKPKLLDPKWKFEDMGIGGLDAEFSSIFRRAFASRLFPPKVMKAIGIRHVKGMLLYGPPGTGKTLIARQIGKMLAGKEPKVVNGPEILNKYVGQSEENIRKLFQEAEEDQAENGDNSELHIIIFDEIDAICKKRGTTGGGTGVNDTVVNQILTKMDGVNSLNNILVIGMTNRKDMIDPALTRPGRLEVHVEISLPDEFGRGQIFKIHTKDMKANNHLGDDVVIEKLAEITKNFSGAEIEGVVKNASSFAMNTFLDVTGGTPKITGDMKKLKVTMAHFEKAIDEATPAFGSADDDVKGLVGSSSGDLINYGKEYSRIVDTVNTLIEQVKTSAKTNMLTVLLEGPSGTGKTAIAASVALKANFPYLKLIAPELFIGASEQGKAMEIAKIFDDAYKSPQSMILIDNLERLLEYIAVGPRFSNVVLQTLLVLLTRPHPKPGRKLMVIATTSSFHQLKALNINEAFNVVLNVPRLRSNEQVLHVLQNSGASGEASALKVISEECALPIGIKQLLMVVEMATQNGASLQPQRFSECLENCGVSSRAKNIENSIDAIMSSAKAMSMEEDD